MPEAAHMLSLQNTARATKSQVEVGAEHSVLLVSGLVLTNFILKTAPSFREFPTIHTEIIVSVVHSAQNHVLSIAYAAINKLPRPGRIFPIFRSPTRR